MATMNSFPVSIESDHATPMVYTGQTDFRFFLFQFEECCPEGLSEAQKVKKLIRTLKGDALTYYCARFCNSDFTKTAEGNSYTIVRQALLDRFAPPEEVYKHHCSRALTLRYKGQDIKQFLCEADLLYTKAEVPEKLKIELLQGAFENTNFPLHEVLIRQPKNYQELKQKILDISVLHYRNDPAATVVSRPSHVDSREYSETNRAILPAAPPTVPPAAPPAVPQVTQVWSQIPLNQPQTPIQPPMSTSANASLEQQLAEVTHQMQQLSLLLGPTKTQKGPRRCLHCGKEGVTTTECPDNPNREKVCRYCDKKGHIEAECFKKQREFKNKTLNMNSPFPKPTMVVDEVKKPRSLSAEEYEALTGFISDLKQYRKQKALLEQTGTAESAPQVEPSDNPLPSLVVAMGSDSEEATPEARDENQTDALIDTLLDVLMSFKRAANGELLPKQMRTEAPPVLGPKGQGAMDDVRQPIRLAPLRIPVKPNPPPRPLHWHPPPVEVREPKKKRVSIKGKPRKKPTRFNLLKTLESIEPPYDGIKALAQANMNVSLGQLLRGDLVPIRNQLRKVLAAKQHKRRVIAATTKHGHKDDKPDEPKAPRRHQTLTVTVYGHPVRALLDTGAIPNLLSLAVAQKIGVLIEPSEATIRVANGDTANSMGEVRNLPVVFDDMVVPLDFIVLENSVLGMILGNPTLENLKMCYDLAKQEVSLSHGNIAVRLPLEYYPSYDLPLTDRYSDFTSITEYDTDDETSELDEQEMLANHVGLVDMTHLPTASVESSQLPTNIDEFAVQNGNKPLLSLPLPTSILHTASVTRHQALDGRVGHSDEGDRAVQSSLQIEQNAAQNRSDSAPISQKPEERQSDVRLGTSTIGPTELRMRERNTSQY